MAQVATEATVDRPREEAAVAAGGLSTEVVLYGLVLIAGGAPRLFGLGSIPLNPAESALAFSSWTILRGPGPIDWSAPAYQSLSALAMWFFGGDDAIPRLVPALAGLATILLIWQLRPLIGRPGALLAAVLIALSPLLTQASRQSSGDALAIAAALGLTVIWFRAGPAPRPVAVAAAGLLAAILLLSGPTGVSIAIALVIYLAVASFTRERLSAVWQPIEGIGREPVLTIVLAGVSLTAIVALATAALAHPTGFGWTSLVAWLGTFDLGASGQATGLGWIGLLFSDPATCVFGLISGASAIRALSRGWTPAAGRSAGLGLWLIVWAGFGLITASLAPGQVSSQAVVPIVPLALLAGAWLGGWSPVDAGDAEPADPPRLSFGGPAWRRWPWLLTLPPLVFFELILLTRVTSATGEGNQALWLLWFAGLLLIAGLILAPAVIDPAEGRPVAVTAGLLLLVVGSLPAAYRLGPSLAAADVPGRVVTLPDVRRLLAELTVAAGHPLSGQTRPIAVEGALTLPLAWYLKDYPTVAFGNTAETTASVVIRPADFGPPPPVGAAQRAFLLTETWQPEFPRASAFARWLVVARPPVPTQTQKVILYANP